MFIKQKHPILLGVALSCLLSACGGSGSSDSSNSSTNESNNNLTQTTYAEISGVAFANKALASAEVNAICKDGSGFKSKVSTNQDGAWSGEVNASQFPCRIEVQADRKYYGYAQKAGNVNVNPLTDLSIAYGSSQLPEIWYKSGVISTDKLNLGQFELLTELIKKGYGIENNVDIFNGKVEIADPIHQVIQNLLEAIRTGNTIKDYDALLILVKDGNLSFIPDKPNSALVDPLNIQVNTGACVPYDPKEFGRYEYCNSSVLPDFEEDQLISVFGQKCVLTKVGEILSITDGKLTISARINQDKDDAILVQYSEGALFAAVNPNPLDADDVTHNVAISLLPSGQINGVTAGNDQGDALYCASTRPH
ncbi:hypothetical protein [Acinetobacter variabilis]|uniref:hypothetical protein n=1 Tax=Acinetobacter variabilis TaxID=70346 RepID=UPI00254CDD98|nr:hypothetical protein [Acinetobacter variabilis]